MPAFYVMARPDDDTSIAYVKRVSHECLTEDDFEDAWKDALAQAKAEEPENWHELDVFYILKQQGWSFECIDISVDVWY